MSAEGRTRVGRHNDRCTVKATGPAEHGGGGSDATMAVLPWPKVLLRMLFNVIITVHPVRL